MPQAHREVGAVHVHPATAACSSRLRVGGLGLAVGLLAVPRLGGLGLLGLAGLTVGLLLAAALLGLGLRLLVALGRIGLFLSRVGIDVVDRAARPDVLA